MPITCNSRPCLPAFSHRTKSPTHEKAGRHGGYCFSLATIKNDIMLHCRNCGWGNQENTYTCEKCRTPLISNSINSIPYKCENGHYHNNPDGCPYCLKCEKGHYHNNPNGCPYCMMCEKGHKLDKNGECPICKMEQKIKQDPNKTLNFCPNGHEYFDSDNCPYCTQGFPSPQSKSLIGNVIKQYRILKLIAEGNVCKIYLAEHIFLGNKVAFKILLSHFEKDNEIKHLFLNGYKLISQIEHPNVIKVLEIIENDCIAVVLEYLDGQSLKNYISNNNNLTLNEITNVFTKVLDTVQFLHAKNIIHRDITPSNIFLIPDFSNIKIIDFNISFHFQNSQVFENKKIGTPFYMSPEQISSGVIDYRSDIYSIGISMYYSILGITPFEKDSSDSLDFLFYSIINNQINPIPNFPSLSEVILKSTTKEKEKRFQSCNEFKQALIDIKSKNTDDYNKRTVLNRKSNNNNQFNSTGCYAIPENYNRIDNKVKIVGDSNITLQNINSSQINLHQDIKYEANNEIECRSKELGQIVYEIASNMIIHKASKCTVRIAKSDFDLDTLKPSDISAFEQIKISEIMKVFLIDPTNGKNFEINSLSNNEQIIQADEYTEWLFNVIPLRKGLLDLYLRVTIVEILKGYGEKSKDIIVLNRSIKVKSNSIISTLISMINK